MKMFRSCLILLFCAISEMAGSRHRAVDHGSADGPLCGLWGHLQQEPPGMVGSDFASEAEKKPLMETSWLTPVSGNPCSGVGPFVCGPLQKIVSGVL